MTDKEKLDFLNSSIGVNYTDLYKVEWDFISRYGTEVSDYVVRLFKNNARPHRVRDGRVPSEDLIRKSGDSVDWESACSSAGLSEGFIREFKDNVDWRCVSWYQELSEDFIREFQDRVDWSIVSMRQKLSEGFIREFQDRVNWYFISMFQELSDDFVREFQDKVNWFLVCESQKLSEGFIREFQDRVDWLRISMYQKLSEGFIREFKDRVYWRIVSMYQKLSDGFIREFQDRVEWLPVSMYQKLSEDSIREFQGKLSCFTMNNWSYKSAEFLKGEVVGTGLYECHDDYFIAYKGIRSDRHSKFNFQYRYLPNHTYESNCDCTSNENSFGLSVWTEEKAREYCGELVVRVRVNYEDVGRVVHNGGKIRCRKLTVLD